MYFPIVDGKQFLRTDAAAKMPRIKSTTIGVTDRARSVPVTAAPISSPLDSPRDEIVCAIANTITRVISSAVRLFCSRSEEEDDPAKRPRFSSSLL